MEVIVILLFVFLFFVMLGSKKPKSESIEERYRRDMLRYENMPLKDYWRAVEHEITYERFTNDGKLEWKQSVLRWRGDPEKERYINLISVRANIERVDMNMPLDEYAMFYFERLVAEHGVDWYIKHENRPYHMLEHESLELFDEDGNQYHYHSLNNHKRLNNGKCIDYVEVKKLIRGGVDYEYQMIGRIDIDTSKQ